MFLILRKNVLRHIQIKHLQTLHSYPKIQAGTILKTFFLTSRKRCFGALHLNHPALFALPSSFFLSLSLPSPLPSFPSLVCDLSFLSSFFFVLFCFVVFFFWCIWFFDFWALLGRQKLRHPPFDFVFFCFFFFFCFCWFVICGKTKRRGEEGEKFSPFGRERSEWRR